MQPSVVIDCFPESLPRHRHEPAVVAVDVFRTTTTLLTAAVLGRRCFPVPTLEAALALARRLPDSLLAGELGGSIPWGFELDNSPAQLVGRSDQHRPLVLLSTAGTRVICGTVPSQVVYAACLRNWSAQADWLVGRHHQVAIIGAGARGEFRAEDAQCCAWIAGRLVEHGYHAADTATSDLIRQWRDTVPAVTDGPSAEFLRSTGRDADIMFTRSHVDDVAATLRLSGDELVLEAPVQPVAVPAS